MRVIVLDLEMCQPSNAILQVGAVLANCKTKQIESSFNMICNPGELPSEEITKLTGITPEQVSKAESLYECLVSFWEWVDKSKCGGRVWAWGSDVYQIKTASVANNVRIPENIKGFDIKEMGGFFRSAIPQARQSGGLVSTLELFGMKFDESFGRQHDAYADSFNTAQLLFRFFHIINKHLVIEKMIST